MKGYVRSIEKAARQNATFRTVLYTAKNCQLVVMSLKLKPPNNAITKMMRIMVPTDILESPSRGSAAIAD